MPEAGPRQPDSTARGWSKAPMTVIVLCLVVLAAFFLAYALALIF